MVMKGVGNVTINETMTCISVAGREVLLLTLLSGTWIALEVQATVLSLKKEERYVFLDYGLYFTL